MAAIFLTRPPHLLTGHRPAANGFIPRFRAACALSQSLALSLMVGIFTFDKPLQGDTLGLGWLFSFQFGILPVSLVLAHQLLTSQKQGSSLLAQRPPPNLKSTATSTPSLSLMCPLALEIGPTVTLPSLPSSSPP